MGKKELNTFETGFESDETPVAVTGPTHAASGAVSTAKRGVHGDLMAPPARAVGDFDTLPPPPGSVSSMAVPQPPRMPALRSFSTSSANAASAALHKTPKARGDYQQTIPTPIPPAMRTPRPNAADERADTAELRVVRNPSAVLLSVSPMAISQPPRASVPMFAASLPMVPKANKGTSLMFVLATCAAALSVLGACAFFLTRQVLHFNTERAYVNEESAHGSDRSATEVAPLRTPIGTSVDTLKPVQDLPKAETKVEPQRSPVAPPSIEIATNVQATRGALRLPKSVLHHRTYIDGKQWVSTKMTVDVPCGSHTVKIGSAGKENTYNVPCGGSIDVQ